MLKKIEGEKNVEYVKNTSIEKEYPEMKELDSEALDTLFSYCRCAIMEVETKFRVLNENFSLEYDRNPIETIKCRIKSMESLAKKIHDRNIPVDVAAIEEHINDIAGIRVICSFPKDIYILAECLLEQDDITLIEKKDYFKNPKPGGYRSLHLIVSVPIFLKNEKRNVKVEVQLRTIAMDFWASLEHKMRYKKSIPEAEVAVLSTELRDCAERIAELDSKMEKIKNRLVKYL